ncbi:MAG: ankyrin repeat domain-containing protein [Cytophagales bacterium]|nr:ankyrin repeat domain-containing protein [Cytophagales bacterium]
MKKIGIQILLLVATLSCSKRKHIELREAQSIQTEGGGQSNLTQTKVTNLYNAERLRNIGRYLYFGGIEGSKKIIGYLGEEGADFNKRGEEGNTLMSFVIQEVSVEISMGHTVEGLSDTNLAEKENFCEEVISLLIGEGASVEVENDRGDTPLHEAAKGGLVRVMQVLIAAGADVNAKNKEGITPLQQAWALFIDRYDFTQEIPLQISYEKEAACLFKQKIDSLLEVIRILVGHGAAPDVKGDIRIRSEYAKLFVKVAYESIKAFLETIDNSQKSPETPYLVWVLYRWRGLDEGTGLPEDIRKLIFSNYYKASPLPLRAIEQFLIALNKCVDQNQASIGDFASITAMKEKGEECEKKICKIKQRREPVP